MWRTSAHHRRLSQGVMGAAGSSSKVSLLSSSCSRLRASSRALLENCCRLRHVSASCRAESLPRQRKQALQIGSHFVMCHLFKASQPMHGPRTAPCRHAMMLAAPHPTSTSTRVSSTLWPTLLMRYAFCGFLDELLPLLLLDALVIQRAGL
jgi:hypothetical protein